MYPIVLIVIVFGIACYLTALLATHVKTRVPGPIEGAPEQDHLPPISILKPIKGVDGGLYENLMSFVRQDYPNYELLFGLQSPDDPALPVLERLKEEHPDRNIRIVITREEVGYNPKVNNLVGMLPHARHEFTLISDSNVRVRPDYLRRNIVHFRDERVGLVTNLIRGAGSHSLAAHMECIHLNSFVMGNVCLSDRIANRQIVVGKSVFFKQSQMAVMGGLEQFANYLAEDYLMGELYCQHGYKVVVSPYLVDTWLNGWPLRSFLNRHARWARLRRHLNFWTYTSELMSNFSFWALVYAAGTGFTPRALGATACLWSAKALGDCLVGLRIGSTLPVFMYALSPFKDLLIALLWPLPLFSSTTHWRGNRLRVSRKSLLTPASHA